MRRPTSARSTGTAGSLASSSRVTERSMRPLYPMRNAEFGMRNGIQFLPFRIPNSAFRIGYNGRMDLSVTLELLAKEPAVPVDLAEVGLLIARDEYPDLHVEDYLKQLDGLAHEGRSYLGSSLQSQVAGLCRFLFHDSGFSGNQK